MQLNPNWFLEAIQGKRTGFLTKSLLGFLFALSLVYRLVIAIRNWVYDTNWKRIHRVDPPVISIGNLTTGGTGKTPMVIWLAKQLRTQRPVHVISRGYGSRQGQLNDEGMEIKRSCPAVNLIQNPDRVAAAGSINPGSDSVILLDDGFQHRRLHRDLDILLIDASNPFGFAFLLPRGLLREPLSSVQRSHLVILTRADLIPAEQRLAIRKELEKHHPQLRWAESQLKLDGWTDIDDATHDLAMLQGQKLYSFSAIGNPLGFVSTLKKSFDHLGHQNFNDHHAYSLDDLSDVNRNARKLNANALVCTMKDLVKVQRLGHCDLPIYALTTSLEFGVGAELIKDLLSQTLPELKDSGRDKPTESLAHR